VTDPKRVAHITTIDLTLRFILLNQLRGLREAGFDVTAVSAPGPWVSDVEGAGIRHIAWPHATRSWDPASDVRAFLELLRILRRERFDLVHTHTPKAGVMGRIAARVTGVPCVVSSIHGLYTMPDDPPRKRLSVLAVERVAALFSDLDLYASEEDLAWARSIRLVSPSKSLLLGNGVDLRRYDPSTVSSRRLAALRQELGIAENALVVGTVGRLVAEKGYRELFTVAREVRREMPDTRFVVLGAPDIEKADAIGGAEMERARDDVIFAGWVEDVREALALMDIFVLPSWREGQPVSVIEAAAMAKPLIVTDIRGCREVVRDGLEGLLVPPRNVARLTSAIKRLAVDADLRRRMGQAARRRAVERFDEQNIVRELLVQYKKLLDRKRVRARGSQAVGGARVRQARPGDASALARIHREALPEGFLSSLGQAFLRRMYLALARDREAVALVAEHGDRVVGFATGVRSVRGFYRRFYLRHGLAAAFAAAPRLLNRETLRRITETARYPSASEDLPESELLSIAVTDGWRSHGLGRALAQGIVDGLKDRGAREIKVVVGADNEGGNRFYAGMGFEHRARIAVHAGTPSNVWVYR
jgi:glycosyltransferase involved in cell wall biosynthesis/ribosomal protein S18 acetylase RimI-like enzyme